MKISYIILTWNSEKYIKKCIESIFNIKEFSNNIIVIDNGSNDLTREILKKYEPAISNIFLDNNIGTTKSRNLGIKKIDKDIFYNRHLVQEQHQNILLYQPHLRNNLWLLILMTQVAFPFDHPMGNIY